LNNLRNNPTSVNMSIRIRERFVVFFNKWIRAYINYYRHTVINTSSDM
jgi:hypothetical protein